MKNIVIRGVRIIEYAPAPVSISTGFSPKTGGPCRAFFREFGGPGVSGPLRRAAKYSGGWSKPLRDRVPDGIWERDEGVEVVNQNRPLFNA